MTTALLIGLVIAAAAFCPLMMRWQNRRGRATACCPPRHVPGDSDLSNLEALRRQRDAVADQLAKAERAELAAAPASLGGRAGARR